LTIINGTVVVGFHPGKARRALGELELGESSGRLPLMMRRARHLPPTAPQ
jgi:hypothetical protein